MLAYQGGRLKTSVQNSRVTCREFGKISTTNDRDISILTTNVRERITDTDQNELANINLNKTLILANSNNIFLEIFFKNESISFFLFF